MLGLKARVKDSGFGLGLTVRVTRTESEGLALGFCVGVRIRVRRTESEGLGNNDG